MFWRIIWPLVIITFFGGAILFANSCGGGGGGSDTPKAENSDSNTDTNNNTENSAPDNSADPPSPNSDNTTPPPDNTDTTPPPDVKTAGLIQLPKTGQTISLAIGDDGDMQTGASWPNPRFIDNSNGTVTDNLTGLMWMKIPIATSEKMTSLNAAVYVDNINRGLIKLTVPYYDWRIPNLNELMSLINFGSSNPALPANHPFAAIKNDVYWTSTTFKLSVIAIDLGSGKVEFMAGNYYYRDDLGKAYLWLARGTSTGITAVPKTGQKICYGPEDGRTGIIDCNYTADSDKRIGWITMSGNSCIYNWWTYDYSYNTPIKREYRIQIPCNGAKQDGQYQAGISWPDPRLIDNGNTVTDQMTGLMWTKNAKLKGNSTWQEALDFIAKMNEDKVFGYSDWRLPNVIEILSITDVWGWEFFSVPPIFQQREWFYWTSTTCASDSGKAWYWAGWLLEVGTNCSAKSFQKNVWAVRSAPID